MPRSKRLKIKHEPEISNGDSQELPATATEPVNNNDESVIPTLTNLPEQESGEQRNGLTNDEPNKRKKKQQQDKNKNGDPETPTKSVVTTSSGRVVSPSKETNATSISLDKWSETELKKLRDAIIKYGQDNFEELASYIGSKTKRQVERQVQKLLKRKKNSQRAASAPTAPIEDWLNAIGQIIGDEADNSVILAQIMAIAGKFEPHDELKQSKRTPKYSNIYQYIASLMSGDTPSTSLTAVESGLVLDLLQSLSDQLQTLDTTSQREFMLEKFKQCHMNITSHVMTITEDDDDDEESKLLININTDSILDTNETEDNLNLNTTATNQAQQRPALFSINPFNIPVKLLKLEVATEDT